MHKTYRNVLITGTTSGIGYSLANEFASLGYGLILVSRDEHKLNKQKDELEQSYDVPIHVIVKDLCVENAAIDVYRILQEHKIRVNILVNNAGFNECGEFQNTCIEKESDMIKLHDIVLTQLTKLFLPSMISDSWGHILNVGSTGSYAPFPINAVYAASKAYVLNYSLALRTEMKGKNVNVTTLTPGATRTLFAEKADIANTFLFSHFVMSPDKVASKAIKGLFKKKAIVIPGIYNKLLVFCMKITPYSLLQWISPFFYQEEIEK